MPVLESNFSTYDLPDQKREDIWHEMIGTVYDVAPSSRLDRNGQSEMKSLFYGDTILTRCHTYAQSFIRSPMRLSTDPVDHYLIQVFLDGGSEMKRGSKTIHVKPGDLVVHDMADTHYAVNDESFTNLTLILPRRVLAPHLEAPDSQNTNVLDPSSALTNMVTNQMHSLYQAKTSIPDSALPGLNESLISLVASAINAGSRTTDQRKLHGAYRMSAALKVKNVIEHNLGNADMNVDELSRMTGVSRSQLYRMFKNFGGVYEYLKKRRLKAALKILADPTAQQSKIYQVALCCGFKTESHFSRTFRETFGFRPKEVQKNPMLAHNQLASIQNPEQPMFNWISWFNNLV